MHAAKVSLAEAKQLVAYLEQEQFAEADALVDAFSMQIVLVLNKQRVV
jgi:hypothetical protein